MSLAKLMPYLRAECEVRYQIPIEQIEAKDIGPTLKFLNILIATPELIRENNGVLSLSIKGYENHPDRLAAHAAIRRFFVLLDCAWPHWFHVCNRVDGTLRLIFTSLVEIYEVESTGDSGRQFECDESALPIFIHSHSIQTQLMHHEAGISPKESLRIIQAAHDYFDILFPPADAPRD